VSKKFDMKNAHMREIRWNWC